MKKINYTLVFVAYLFSFNSTVMAQEILPMPGQKLNNRPNTTDNINQKSSNSNNRYNINNSSNSYSNTKAESKDNLEIEGGASEIIPMPNKNKNRQNENKTIIKQNTSQGKIQNTIPSSSNNSIINNTPNISDNPDTPFIALPTRQQKKQTPQIPKSANNDINLDGLSDNSGFTSSNSLVDNILPSNNPDTTVAQSATGENITVFPKDTGSAIFMVMKSWNCEDYDGASLINQALDVYAKDSGEEFVINGIENLDKGLKVSIEEEDITFDELLDIFASSSGNDWGCDVANKTIYIYPKGIKSETYLSWE